MRFTIQIDSDNGQHCRMTLFVNGANTGRLCMTSEEAKRFIEVLKGGQWSVVVHGDPLPERDYVPYGAIHTKKP